MLHRLSQNTLILLVNNIGTAILSFLLAVIIARGMGDEGLGQYATVMAWVFPLTLFADFGISTLLTRDLAQDTSLIHSYIQQALWVRWFWGGGLVMAVWFLAPYLSADTTIIGALRVGIWLILIDNIFGIYTAVWRARETMFPILILNIALLTMQAIGVFIAIHLDADMSGIFAAVVVADVIQLFAAWLVWRRFTLPSLSLNPISLDTNLIDFMKHSWQFAIAGILAATQARLIFLLLEHFTNSETVGWYAAASRFVEGAKMPIFALFGSLFPAMSGLVATPERLRQTFRRMNLGLLAYGIAAGIGLTLLGGWVIKLAFGAEFSNAAPVLTILGWALIPLLLRQNATLYFYVHHQERLINQITLAVLVVQLPLGIILIQNEAGQGAAWTIFLTESLFLGMLVAGRRGLMWLVPLFLVLVGLATRLELLRDLHFDGLYGQDAFAYFNYGVEVKNAIHDVRVPAEMYWGLGFPVLLGAGFIVNGISAHTAQFLVLWSGALTCGLTYLLMHDLMTWVGWSRRHSSIAGLVAGLLVLFSGQHLQSSVVVMADVPSLLWATLSAWCLVRYATAITSPSNPLGSGRVKSQNVRIIGASWIVLASMTLALAGMTRWVFYLLAFPWGLCCLYLWEWRIRWRDAGLAVLAGGVLLLIQLAHSSQNPDSLVGHSWLQSWSPANALQKDFVNPDGTFHYAKPVAEFYARAAWDGFYVHPVFLPLMMLGVAVLLRRDRRYVFAGILLLGWLAVVYGFLAGIPYQNIRFSLGFFSPLAGLAGIGLVGLWRVLDRAPAIGWGGQGVTVLAMCLALSSTYQAGHQEVKRFAETKASDLATVDWTRAQIPEGNADVYTLELWLMMRHYAPEVTALQIYYETPETLATHNFSEHPTYLLLNLWAIENQWIGKAPYLAYHWINDHVGLTYLGRHGNYYLWRVNA